MVRPAFVLIHRYVGLAITVFLVVAGLTGSLLVFNHELDRFFNRGVMTVQPTLPEARPLDVLDLRERVLVEHPGWAIQNVPLRIVPGEALSVWIDNAESSDNQYFLDPYSAKVLGSRRSGDLSQGLTNLMPFLYRLHYSLALGRVGSWLFGIAALLWTVDCFVGAYLTFPLRSRSAGSPASDGPRRNWLMRWWPAWLVKSGSLYKLTFTWHRASGLWIWGLLFVFAWSAVGLNLRSAYDPVMTALFGPAEEVWSRLPELPAPRLQPRLSWHGARTQARALMTTEAARKNFTVTEETGLGYDRSSGLYHYNVISSRDVAQRFGGTTIWLDGDSGALVAFDAPTGQQTRRTVHAWLFALHFAHVGGWPYRVLVFVTGVVIALLSVSGVYLWWVKRGARQAGRSRE